MQAENRENSLEIWKLQRQSTVLMKSLGEDAAASESIEQETKDLVERNNKLSADISVEINEVLLFPPVVTLNQSEKILTGSLGRTV